MMKMTRKQKRMYANLEKQIAMIDGPHRFDEKQIAYMSDAFLGTYEWRQVRMKALKRDGAKCQCCGATPATGAVMNVDHIKPRKTHPHLALTLENLQVLCHECNHGKGNWDSTNWRNFAPK